MSSWKEVHKGASNGSELAAVEALWQHFAGSRTIIEALTGYTGDAKAVVTRCKVTLFYELGRVKCSVGDPASERVGFVTLDPEDGDLLECLEAALGRGIDWRKAPKRDREAFRR